jgi:hypothetical protein
MRSLLLILAGALVLVACADTSDSPERTASDAPTVTVDQVRSPPGEDVPSALFSMTAGGLPDPLVDPDEVTSGGPPPDGIPSIDDPVFIAAADVDFLADNEAVLALELDGDARAYPVQILMWHEIVNDTVAGEPVTVTYCPLCNTAVVVQRTVDDRVLDFGTSGLLYQSALVMYDRQTESLWSHFTGEAIAGVLTGTVLERLPVATVAWGDWLDANPDGLVLSLETGESRSYGVNPYVGYDDVDATPFLFDGEVDDRLPAMERVVGFGLGHEPVAVRHELLLDAGVIEVTLDGEAVVVFAQPGTASALDTGDIVGGRDVGSTGVFRATHDGEILGFERTGGGFVDDRTGSRWDIFGAAVEGPLAGERLERLAHLDTFWFAWSAFSPDTELVP